MKISIAQFGTSLVGRDVGQSAYEALYANVLRGLPENETIEVDFAGVDVLTPSWAENFFGALHKQYGQRVILVPSDNTSVRSTLAFITKGSSASE